MTVDRRAMYTVLIDVYVKDWSLEGVGVIYRSSWASNLGLCRVKRCRTGPESLLLHLIFELFSASFHPSLVSYFISLAAERGGERQFPAALFAAFLMHDSDLERMKFLPPSCNFKIFKLKI